MLLGCGGLDLATLGIVLISFALMVAVFVFAAWLANGVYRD